MTNATANGALYDATAAEEFLNMLFRNVDWLDGEVISLLGIGEKGTQQEGVFRDRIIIPPAFIGSAHVHLKRWAEHHVAGFIVPAVLKPAAKEKGDVTLDKVAALTAIILDLDSGDVPAKLAFVTQRLGQPSMTVASGGVTSDNAAKLHLYWLFNEPCEDVERVAALRKQLAAKVAGDQSFGRATQVIRVPGSVHAKHGKAAVCSILARSTAEYSFDDLADTIENMSPMPGLPAPVQANLPALSMVGGMDFSPREDTALVALHRDVHEGGDDVTRFSAFSQSVGFLISEARAGRTTLNEAVDKANGWMLLHMIPPWPQERFRQEFTALYNKDVTTHGPFPVSIVARAETAIVDQGSIEATPATYPPSQSIPPRPWLVGRWFQRKIVTAIIAPGGVGKSSLMAALTLSMSSGDEFLGKSIYGGPLRTWYINLEDSGDNLARSRVAAMMHHGITKEQLGDRMFVDSGPDGAGLCVAVEDRAGFVILVPIFDKLKAEMIRRKIDLLIIDPFVSCHQVDENDNNRIDAVVKEFARLGAETNAAIGLVHHSRKMNGDIVNSDSARGASALNNAARTTLVLNQMTTTQAEAWDVDWWTARSYFSVADDKHNMALAEGADWFKLVGVDLDNAAEPYGSDNVGVVTRWIPPEAMDGVDPSHLLAVQHALTQGTHWQNAQSQVDWAGDAVAIVMGFDSSEPGVRNKIKGMLNVWIKSGALKKEMRLDSSKRDHRLRAALVPGMPAPGTDVLLPTMSDEIAERNINA